MTKRVGLIGKMPAHGDFVRRGPALVVAHLERWLDEELGRIDPAPRGALLAALPIWSFSARLPGGAIAGAMCASCDRVGRLYPLVIFADGVDPAMLVPTADAFRDVFSAIRADVTADALVAAGASASAEAVAVLPPASGSIWWRHEVAEATAFPGLPHAVDWVASLAEEPA